jgi:hypothetical protein
MKRRSLWFGIGLIGLMFGTGCATEDGWAGRDGVAFYEAGLVCPAAPKIGCGSAAKPILLELEKTAAIREAWLNREGTMVAVVPEPGVARKEAMRSAARVFKAHEIEAGEVKDSADLEAAFAARRGWLRGADVDQLSIEEAGIIAERVLRRVETKTPIAEKDKAVLRAKFKEMIEARFVRNSGPTTREEWHEKTMEMARAVLNAEQLAALEGALAQGFRPRAGEE